MAKNSISNSAAWFKLTPEKQKAITELSFKEKYASGNNAYYNNADAAKRSRIKQAYTNMLEDTAYSSEFNPSTQRRIDNQAEADDSSPFRNTITKIGESFKDTIGRIPMTLDAMNPDGKVSDKLAERAAKHFARQDEKIITEEQKGIQNVLATAEKEIDKAGGFWSLGGLKAAAATVPELVANPWGVIQVGADSSASMAVMGAGALAGGIAAGPVGSAIGMFATETADAANSKFLEIARERLKSQGLPPTEANLNQLFQDTEFVKAAQITSDKYATALAATGVVTGAVVGRLVTSPARAALKAARETVTSTDNVLLATAAKAKNIPVEQFIDGEVNRIASATLKAQSFKAKLGYSTANYAGAIASEPVSEAVAKTVIGEKATFTDLMNETLGGIGMGPIEASINKAAFGTKIAGAAIVDTAKDIINSTPETKMAAVERKNAMAAVQTLAKTEAVHDYDNKIAEITPDSDEFKAIADPTNKDTYNPIAAMDALIGTEKKRKPVDPEIHGQALKVANDYMTQLVETNKQLEAIKAKGESVTPDEVKQAKHLEELGLKQFEIANKLYKRVELVTTQLNNAKAKPTPIDVVNDSADNVMVRLGSHGTSNKDTIPMTEVEQLLEREDIKSNPVAVNQLTKYKEAKTLREQVEIQQQNMSKSMAEVSTDIYHGKRGMDFKGIDAYQEGIKHFLNPKVNNEVKAQTELDGLRKFSEVINEKADVAEAVFQSMAKNKEYVPTAEQQAVLDYHKLSIHPIVSKNLVPQIRMEANALNSEVALAEATYKALSGKSNTITSAPVQTAPTASVAKPTIAPVVSVPVVSVVKPKTGVTRLQALQTELKGGTITEPGLKEIRDIYQQAKKNGDTKEHLDHIIELGNRYKRAYHKTTESASIAVPETASDTKPIVAPTPGEIVAPVEHKVGSNEWLKQQRLDENLYGDTEGKVDNGTLTSYAKDGNISAQAELDRRYINEAKVDFKEWSTPSEDVDNSELIGSLEDLVQRIDRHEAFVKTGVREEFKQQVVNTIKELESKQIEYQTNETKLDEISVDSLSEYDIDPSTLEITYIDAFGNEVTKTYAEALKENQKQLKEANEVLKCVTG